MGTLEVEARIDHHRAVGIEVQVYRFERIDGARSGQWREPSRAMTNAEGLARFDLPASHHLVVAKLNAQTSVSKQFDVAGGPTVDHLVLEAGEITRLSGTTFDAESKQPLGGVDVVWRPELLAPAPDAASIRTQADSLGRFVLDVPRETAGSIEAHAPGYSAAEVETASKDQVTPIELSLEPASVAQGVVVNSSGAPVAGASVRSQPSDGPAVLSSTSGAFMLQIPAGGVTLEALTSSGRRAIYRINAAPPRETVRGVTLVIDDGLQVTGRVIEGATGAPAPNATVRLFSEPDALELATVTSNAEGRFQFAAIPTGRYSLFAQQGQGSRGRTVGVELPASIEPVVTLTAAASIGGRVLDEAGGPVVGAEVTLDFPRALREPSMRVRANEAGDFLFEGALASMVTLTAKMGTLQTSEDVYAAPDQLTRVDLSFQQGARIVGRVLGATRVYRVSAWKQAGRGHGVEEETDTDGRFILKVSPGTYSVGAMPNHAMRVKRMNVRQVVVKAGEDTNIDLTPAVELSDAGDLENMFFNGVADGIAFESENGAVKVGFLTSQSLPFKAGLRTGDLVLSINGAAITTTLDAFAKARGSPAEYVIRRAGSEIRFRVTSEPTD